MDIDHMINAIDDKIANLNIESSHDYNSYPNYNSYFNNNSNSENAFSQNGQREIEISRSYDYSNVVADVQSVSYLVQTCETFYKKMMQLFEEEEQKNVKLKPEYKNYEYQKGYSTSFYVSIKESANDGFSHYSTLDCKTYESFVEAVKAGHLNYVENLIITLDLSFRKVKGMSKQDHNNLFKICFKPYNIQFSRKSNFEDENMTQIENAINETLKKFKIQNTIFCNK